MGTKTIIKTEQRLTEFGYIDGDRTVTTISCEDCIALEYYITDLKQQLAKQAEQLKEAKEEISELKRLFQFRCECMMIPESVHKCSACYSMELHEAKYKGKE